MDSNLQNNQPEKVVDPTQQKEILDKDESPTEDIVEQKN